MIRFAHWSLWLILVVVFISDGVRAADATLVNAIDQYDDAVQRNDIAAMARFYLVENATDDRLPLANARRIVSARLLESALKQHVAGNGGSSVVTQFGLIDDALDIPSSNQASVNDDDAVVTEMGPDGPSIWFKKVKGVWLMDITPSSPMTAVEHANEIEEDNSAVERITADANAGRLATPSQVRDALGNVMLNAAPQGVLSRNDFRLEGEPLPPTGMHDRPDPHGVYPQSPSTPAGAMNRFVAAIEKGDETTVGDALFLPQDRDGACRAAAAHDYVLGLRLLTAAELRFPKREDSDRIAFYLGFLQRSVLRSYTDDEWRIEPGYPGLAMSSWETTLRTDTTADRKLVPVHENTGVPIMHHSADSKWQLGPRFPQNARQLKIRATTLTEKDKIFEEAIVDLQNGKYASDAAAIAAVSARLQPLGSQWKLNGYSNSE